MKKVLYIHQYFKTPDEDGAIRSYHISKSMANRGFQVEMITAHNHSQYEQKIIDGIHIHYLPVSYSNEYSSSQRYRSFFKFVFLAIRLVNKLPKSDIVFATSTPLTVGLIALYLKRIKGIPYVFEVRDLWPEAPIQMRIIKSPIVKYVAQYLEKSIYKNASRIVALSPGIQSGVLSVHKNADVELIPNMADIDFFQENPQQVNHKKEFVIGYFGAFGAANHLEYILKIASECQKLNLPIKFILVGDGAKKSSLINLSSEMKLNNVKFHSTQNRLQIKESMKDVDACFTSFLKIPILETNSPNKFFDGLAAGKLSIVNTNGWLRELVEHHGCGFYIDPDKPEKFPEHIFPFIENKELLISFQENALNLAYAEFSKEKLVNKVCGLVEPTL